MTITGSRFRSPRRWLSRGIVLAFVSAFLLAAGGCGNNDNPVTVVEYCAEFEPDQAPAPGTVSVRLGDDSICNVIELEFVANGINDVVGFAADITFDPSFIVQSQILYDGSVLAENGAQLAANVSVVEPGRLVVGVSRVTPEGQNIADTSLLFSLYFLVDTLTEQSGEITVENECLIGGPNDQPETIPGVTCSGGTIRVR